jgi:hypothetical protein
MMDVNRRPVGAKRQINLDDIASTLIIEPTVELLRLPTVYKAKAKVWEESTKVSTVTTMTLSRIRMISMTIKPLKK